MLLICSTTSVVIFLINFVCTVYFKVKWVQEGDINTMYLGNCSQTDKFNTGLHTLINILSTLLLGASNIHMQLLAAPTRSEIERAHTQRVWLDIGIPHSP